MSITDQPWRRVVTPGLVGGYGDRRPRLFVSIRWEFDRNQQWELSIAGVVGPNRHGGATGDAGQCRGELEHTSPADGWTIEMIEQLHAIWERWHLNGLRAGCEHQRAEGWDKRPIDPSKPLDSYGKHFDGQTSLSRNMLTDVLPSEHPDGLLTVGCPTCGYRYGTKWLHEDVPADVLEWLYHLPVSPRDHPWGDTDRLLDPSITITETS